MRAKSRRIVFVVNPITDGDLVGGNRDVSRVYSILTDPELGMCDPGSPKPFHECKSQNDFQTALMSILKEWRPEDQLIFYYTGHGKKSNNEFCFMFGEELFPFNNLMNFLRVYKVTKTILIIDACYAATALGIKGEGELLEPVNELGLPEGIAILVSSLAHEESYEIEKGVASVFTNLFCKGIEEGLDKPTTGDFICVDDIIEYINGQIESDKKYLDYPQHAIHSVHGANRKIWIAHNKHVRQKNDPPAHKDQQIRSSRDLEVWFKDIVPTKRPCLEARIDDLDWELIEQYAQAQDPGAMREVSREKTLERLHLFSAISPDEKRYLNKSAILCFAREPSNFYNQARAVFVTGQITEKTFVKKDIQGPLSKQVAQLVEQVMAHLDTFQHISDDGLRRDMAEIDHDVIREVISNAVVHRNYENNGTIQVRITPDALEVVNPGSFPRERNWDALLKSKYPSNPVDVTIALYLEKLSAKPFEGIGRGFTVFRQYIMKNGRKSITCVELPGPAVCVRVLRRKPEDLIDKKMTLLQAFGVYLTELLISIFVFAMFVSISIGASWIEKRLWVPPASSLVIKIASYIILTSGTILTFIFLVRTTWNFIIQLKKGKPSDKAS